MALITNTYSDEDIVKSFLLNELYETATFDTDIATQAANTKDEINTYLGKQSDFTVAELAEVKNKGIVLAASRHTAYLMQLNPQERAENIAKATIFHHEAARELLDIWMKNNGLKPPAEKKTVPTSVKIAFVYSEESNVI